VIENGIKRPVRFLLENHCLAAALILTYSGIEMMAFLNLPSGTLDVTRSVFIDWADKYVIPCLRQNASRPTITGKDLYGARCSAVRGTDSRLVREGHCRLIRYASTNETATLVEVEELVGAFFRGVDAFIAETLLDQRRAELLTTRLEQILKTLPF